MTPIRSLWLTAALLSTLAAPRMAAAVDDTRVAVPAASAAAAAAADMTDGEVRRIDLEAGKVTLKHGEIKNLDMPAMTMVFVVKDKALLDKLKVGDKVKFKASNEAGKFTVTEIASTP